MANVQVTAPGKLAALLLVLAGCFAYVIFRDGDSAQAWATLTLVVGYLVGNGAGAKRGIETVSPFSPKSDS